MPARTFILHPLKLDIVGIASTTTFSASFLDLYSYSRRCIFLMSPCVWYGTSGGVLAYRLPALIGTTLCWGCETPGSCWGCEIPRKFGACCRFSATSGAYAICLWSPSAWSYAAAAIAAAACWVCYCTGAVKPQVNLLVPSTVLDIDVEERFHHSGLPCRLV